MSVSGTGDLRELRIGPHLVEDALQVASFAKAGHETLGALGRQMREVAVVHLACGRSVAEGEALDLLPRHEAVGRRLAFRADDLAQLVHGFIAAEERARGLRAQAD